MLYIPMDLYKGIITCIHHCCHKEQFHWPKKILCVTHIHLSFPQSMEAQIFYCLHNLTFSRMSYS